MNFILLSTILIAAVSAQAQSTRDSTNANDLEYYFESVDVQPQPLGGLESFGRLMAKNKLYPQEARDKDIWGKVFVQFVVEKDGEILKENVKVIKALYKVLDEEAVRLVLLSSPWEPGMHKGKIIRTRMILSFNFPY